MARIVILGVPKIWFMIESMVESATSNIGQLLRGELSTYENVALSILKTHKLKK